MIKRNYINKLLTKNDSNSIERNDMLKYFEGKEFNRFYDNINKVINKYWNNNNIEHYMNVWNDKHNNSRYLFIKSMTHKSYFINKTNRFYYNYEKMEFAGDTHLNYFIKCYIHKNFTKYGNQHLLSKISNFLISKKFYKKLFDDIGLYGMVFYDKDKIKLTDSIKEDILESFMYAFLCVFGRKYTRCLVNKLIGKYKFEWILNNSISYKSILNEELFIKYKKSFKDVVRFNIKKNKKQEFFCLGYSINNVYHKNKRYIVNKNKMDLIESLCEDILTII